MQMYSPYLNVSSDTGGHVHPSEPIKNKNIFQIIASHPPNYKFKCHTFPAGMMTKVNKLRSFVRPASSDPTTWELKSIQHSG